MKLWVEAQEAGYQVNFQPELPSEAQLLDRMLRCASGVSQPLSSERDRTVAMGAPSVAKLSGHGSQRWISIPKSKPPEVKVVVERIEVPLDPAIDVFRVAVHRATGVWQETCASAEALHMFLRGVQAGAENFVSLPEIPQEATLVLK